MLCAALVFLAGCDGLPFIDAELKARVCDRDSDGLWRDDIADHCGGDDCDDGDGNVGEPTSWYRDVDSDTFGAGEPSFACEQPDGFVAVPGDCDDTDEAVNLLAPEICNLIDDNCDEVIDDQNIPTWYRDADMDGYGNPEIALAVCNQPDGYVADNADCDDSTDAVSPQDIEVCDDGIDQDCNEVVDDAQDAQLWCADTDLDSFGDPAACLYSCELEVDGLVLDNTDCDDTLYDVSPTAFEACEDGIDNDCDGEIDTDAVDVPWYRDADEDGYGDSTDSTTDCAPPDGYVGNAQDCDDALATVNPAVAEVCNNGVDDNCDESPGDCALTGTMSLATADIAIEWSEPDEYAGTATVGPCDLDGDGFGDLVVTKPYDDLNGDRSGSVFVFFSPSLTEPVMATDTADAIFIGESPNDFAGSALACGDVDGDGVDDLLIGAPGYDNEATGAIYLFYGGALSETVSLANADAKWTGTMEESAVGERALAIADVDADGLADIIVGVSNNDTAQMDAGAVYLINGGTHVGTTSLADADAKWTGEAAEDRAGRSVAACDVDNDGSADIIVGAYNNDEAGSEAGKVYFISGGTHFGTTSLTQADAAWTGEAAGDFLGQAVACGGDVNADGVGDIVASAIWNGGSGAVYLIEGGAFSGTVSMANANAKLTGEFSQDMAGTAIALCDVDHDGYDDVLVGAPDYDGVSYKLGAVYLIKGGSPVGTTSLANADAKWIGVGGEDQAGSNISCLGVVNPADMVWDFIVGAPYTDTAYLIYGLGF